MAVNQAQVDHIISTASADDPEVKLLKLQDEVELLKTSIKRLLIDIRERMNDMENPIVIATSGGSHSEVSEKMANVFRDTSSAMESAAGALKSSAQAQAEESRQAVQQEPAPYPDQRPQGQQEYPPSQIPSGVVGVQARGDMDILAALKAQISSVTGENDTKPVQETDKVRLQKVFRLFEWTSKNVKKFGHDRVDLMLDSYLAMGYISEQSCKLVKDMSRLMPQDIGELHEIRADEFVSELYELNHILNPVDATLDRDMIEVLMDKREDRSQKKGTSSIRQAESGNESDYIHSRDRI
jgi:gas vesicle protein